MPVLNDLIELSGYNSNTTYSTTNGGIKGVVDNAFIQNDGDGDNRFGTNELNVTTGGRPSYITINGQRYRIASIREPADSHGSATITKVDNGTTSTQNLLRNGTESQVAFMRLVPVNAQGQDTGGADRYFMVVDDRVGSLNITSVSTHNLHEASGSDVIIHLNNNDAINTFVCFASGTLIDTADGPRAIQDLAEGDMVITRDEGAQPLAWVGSRHLTAADLAAKPALCPIRIRAGALGNNLPKTDLVVSPQHRILVRSNIAQTMFGAREVLVAAKQLLMIDGIDRAEDMTEVTYHHMLFRDHQIVIANGAETESLFTGPEALKGVGAAARDEILALFPELGRADFVADAARPLVPNRMARKMASRHVQNGRALVS